ncbi:MAG: metal-dependent hydrolase [Candidatus Tectomicrobia bacterium]|uniref:Metal-dependent hydrolase n=1 Tax=Tectimicrobiota bacterium TaxID=2528274 RepID=A0A932GS29_UNCTE|nr:metal-dependent hydrolase [Candidatus Tectomicrobia bacterium]
MDFITHTLSGIAVANAGFRQRIGRSALLAVTAGAIAPDLDSVMGLWDQFAAIKYHRGLTHSLLGGILLALLVAWPIYRWGAHKQYGKLVGLVYLGILVHIGLDLITSFGIQVFYPFSDARLAWDLAFIIDPILTATFAVPLLVAWRRPRLAARAVWAGLSVAVLYLALAAGAKAAAQARFAAELDRRVIAADRIGVVPRLHSPFRWRAVAQAPGRLYQAAVAPWPGGNMDVRSYIQAPRNRYVERSDAAESVRLFLWFARFPWIRYLESGGEHIVEYRDIRFGADGETNHMVLRVVMDTAGVVKSVYFNHRF